MASLDAKNKEDIGYRFSIVMVRGMGGSREGEGGPQIPKISWWLIGDLIIKGNWLKTVKSRHNESRKTHILSLSLSPNLNNEVVLSRFQILHVYIFAYVSLYNLKKDILHEWNMYQFPALIMIDHYPGLVRKLLYAHTLHKLWLSLWVLSNFVISRHTFLIFVSQQYSSLNWPTWLF